MNFSDLQVKDVHSVVIYNTNTTHWVAQNRKNHFIGIQTKGSALHDFGYKKFVLNGNCVYFFNQNDDYSVKVYEPCESFSIHFTSYGDIDTESFCIPVSNSDEFISILKKAEKAHRQNDTLTLLSLVYLFSSKIEQYRQKPYSQKDSRAADAKEYIDLHFSEKDCLRETVKRSSLTERRLSEIFKNAFGMTLNGYIILKKVEYAKALLTAPALSVGEISLMCGFSDIYSFSKTFKKITGVSPSKMR